MCVGLPGRVVEVVDAENGIVEVRIGERTHRVSAAILEGVDVQVGDWLEIHMGHALAKLSDEEARDMLDFMNELDAAHRSAVDEFLDGANDAAGGGEDGGATGPGETP